MARLRYNGLSTTLGASLTNVDTSVTFGAALTHSNGTAVPTITGSDYIPLSILDSSGHLSEIVWLTAYTTGTTTGTIARGKEGTSGVAHSSGDKVVQAPLAEDVSGGVVGFNAYLPASSYAVSSSASHVQVDSTNLKVSFVTPQSGRVMVQLTALVGGPQAIGQWIEWSLFESGTMITGSDRQVLQGATSIIPSISTHVITGLTPGSVHTYTWGWRSANCGGTIYNTPTVMTVTALP